MYILKREEEVLSVRSTSYSKEGRKDKNLPVIFPSKAVTLARDSVDHDSGFGKFGYYKHGTGLPFYFRNTTEDQTNWITVTRFRSSMIHAEFLTIFSRANDSLKNPGVASMQLPVWKARFYPLCYHRSNCHWGKSGLYRLLSIWELRMQFMSKGYSIVGPTYSRTIR